MIIKNNLIFNELINDHFTEDNLNKPTQNI